MRRLQNWFGGRKNGEAADLQVVRSSQRLCGSVMVGNVSLGQSNEHGKPHTHDPTSTEIPRLAPAQLPGTCLSSPQGRQYILYLC